MPSIKVYTPQTTHTHINLLTDLNPSNTHNISKDHQYGLYTASIKHITIPLYYNKLNIYRFVSTHQKGNIYKNPLTNLPTAKLEQHILDFELPGYDKITKIHLNDLSKDINKLSHSVYLNGSCDILIMPHDVRYIYFTHTNPNTNPNRKYNFGMVRNLVISQVNTLLIEIQKLFMSYTKLNNMHKTKDFYEIMEHLAFNVSFGYLKQYNLYVNPVYINSFGHLKEVLIKHNKYISEYYHPLPNSKDNLKLQITNVGLYSISKPFATAKILEVMKRTISYVLPSTSISDLIITDATAGVGGDTLAFAKEFKYVNSVEIQKIHHNVIKNNSALYHLDNINHINDDYTKIYNKLFQNVIFIDSPWGGTQYKNMEESQLTLFGTDIPFNTVVADVLKINPDTILFIKTPSNYNIQDLDNELYSSNIPYKNFDINKVANFILIAIY